MILSGPTMLLEALLLLLAVPTELASTPAPSDEAAPARAAAAAASGSLDARLRSLKVELRGDAAEVGACAEEREEREVRRVLLASLEAGGEAALEELRWLSPDLHDLRGTLLRALGSSGDPRALDWIVEQLDDPALVDDAFHELLRFRRELCGEHRERAAARAVELLAASDPARRRLARSVVAALGVEEAVPALVEALASAEPHEQGAIVESLTRITGACPGPTAEAWERWLQGELEWSAVHAARHLAGLGSGVATEVVRAVEALSGREYQRDRWARALVELLAREARAELRRQAWLGLVRLHSTAVTAELGALLAAEQDEALRALGQRALEPTR